MTFIDEFEQELLRQLESSANFGDIVEWASEKVLESYRNGITQGQKGASVKRKGKSRRHSIFLKEE